MTIQLTDEALAAVDPAAQLSAGDFEGLRGIEFYDPHEPFELMAILEWSFVLGDDTDGHYLRFELLGGFSYGGQELQESFTLWVSKGGNLVSDLLGVDLDYTIAEERIEPLLKTLKLI